jgi:hypothetical protein
VTVEAGRLLIASSDPALTTGIGSTVEVGFAGSTFGDGTGAAGTVLVRAGDIEVRAGGLISSSTRSPRGGAAGDVAVSASRLVVADGGEIASSGLGVGPAGDVRIEAGTLLVDRGGIRTVGAGATGGSIEVVADDLVVLDGAEVTSNGIEPVAGASLISVQAPLVVLLDSSRVTSLTGRGAPLAGSGEARLLGDLTFVSDDSQVRGSSTVELAGIDNQVGTGLQLAAGAFVNAGALLGESCTGRRTGETSTFARAGRGGLPPGPDRPLASRDGPGSETEQTLRAGDVLRVAAAGCAGATGG